ncbi:MAG: NADH-quinone oxidoreductase subunit NuoG [Deltaproteobacteria bacterium]|nr:NADH-quinone oxidoreductase subunit NuoG [Deltaproteobacteria bacterium]
MNGEKFVTLKVNGKEVTVKEGTLILDAAREAGYEIPTFCYQENLSGVGSCRICFVEIEGQKKLQPSCITPVMADMNVRTDSAQVIAARGAMLEFVLTNHALDCPVCDKGGECELQNMVWKFGPRKGRFTEKKIRFHEKDYILSPVIVKNSNRCVHCMRCVRVCSEVVGKAVLGVIGREAHQEMTSFVRSYLDCDHDGMCIEVCPVGCFMRLPYRYKARHWDLKSAKTVCPYCATGCRMTIQERDGVVVRSIARLGSGFNGRMMCARGRFGYDFLNSKERLKTPLLKVGGVFKEVSWDKALGVIREKFTRADPKKVFGVASARLTNEELYLFQKLVRSVFNSPNLDSTSRWNENASAAFISAAGIPGRGTGIYGAMEADCVFIAGAQISDENPVTDYIVRYTTAAKRNSVIIASSRAMKLDSSSRMSIRHLPGRLGSLLNATALSLYMDYPERLEGTPGIDGIKGKTVEGLGQVSGVEVSDIKSLAGVLRGSASVSILAGVDFLRFREGILGLRLLGAILKTLGKQLEILPLLDRSNQRGAWDMGVHPLFGPGYGEVKEKGLGVDGMLERANEGASDAFYIIGEDILSMYPDRAFAARALSRAGFLVYQDMFMTETAQISDLVLPGASFAEKAGTFTNQEGRVQAAEPLLSPKGEAKTDLEIISAIGSSIAPGFTGADPQRVFEEIRGGLKTYEGIFPGLNDSNGVMVKGSGNTLKEFEEVKEAVSDLGKNTSYPYYLITGNHLFHSGRLSRRSEILRGLLMEPVIEISSILADELGVEDGSRVMVNGRESGAVFSVRVKKGTPKEVVFIPENFEKAPANRFFKRGETVARVNITVHSSF